MRRLLHRTALFTAILALAVASPAFGQGAFSPLPAPTTAPPPTVASPSTNDDQGLDTWQQILLFAGGVALIAGISYAILSDARKVAPVTDDDGGHALSGAAARKAHSKEAARKKAKAQRAARKRQRKR